MTNSNSVLLEDETLRDGLQADSRIFSLEEKISIYKWLKKSGVKRIQIGLFVHPKLVPQMADTEELIHAIRQQEKNGPLLTGLILNDKGLDRALDCSLEHVSMSVSVSNSHSMKNAGKSAADALLAMTQLIKDASTSGITIRAGLQCSFGCIYGGPTPESSVVHVAEQLVQAGTSEINLADSTGMANPKSIQQLVLKIQQNLPETKISLHVHDTRGLGLANMYAGYNADVRMFDVCTGGLEGCPFIKGATGNVPTEDAVNMFSEMGVETGIDIHDICATLTTLEKILGRKLLGRICTINALERKYARQEIQTET